MQTCMWPSWCRCHSLSLSSVKSRLVLPFSYRLTWVVPEKGPLNGCVCVYLHVRNILACWYMLICLWLCCVKLLKLSSCHFLQLFLTKGYICWSEYLFSIPGSISLIYMHFGTNQIVYSTSEWCVIVPSSLFSHLCRPRTESCYTIWIGLTW